MKTSEFKTQNERPKILKERLGQGYSIPFLEGHDLQSLVPSLITPASNAEDDDYFRNRILF